MQKKNNWRTPLIYNLLYKTKNIFFFLEKSLEDQEKWGTFHNNGSGTGMIGTLLVKKADIAIGTITPREQSHRSFDFTAQYYQVT